MKILLPALALFCGVTVVCAQKPIPSPEKGPGWIAFDFETGDMQGWRIVSGANGHPIAENSQFRNIQHKAMNKEGRYYLGTLETKQGGAPDDKQTCVIESPVFKLAGPTVRLAVSGGSSPKTYLALCTLDGKEVQQARGRDSEIFYLNSWEVPELVGQPVFIRLVDQSPGAWGHIVVDAISARGQLLPEATEKRFAHIPKPRNPNQALSPDEAIATFTLPEGFTIELVASEAHGVINPIDIAFDDAGRLWTQTARMYPLDPVTGINFGKAMRMMRDQQALAKNPAFARVKRLYQMQDKGTDQILILDDPTRTAEQPLRVWADGLTIPQSVIPYKNGAYVAHGSELFFLEDRDGDGRADSRTPVLSGFGFFDTHTMAHGLVRAPGGWFHFSHGLINSGDVTVVATGERQRIEFCLNARFSNDHRQLEIVNVGLQNIWGYQLRSKGQWYGTEANDMGLSVIPMEIRSGFRGHSNPMIRPYQPLIQPQHYFRVGGTGISGLAFSEDGVASFPAPWREVALLANPITRKINAVRIERKGDGALDAEHLADFLSSSDPWFRPVTIEFGPDGCLYVADWCNKIISHNEVDTAHPDRDKKHGRIWRIRHENQALRKPPNLIAAREAELVAHLSAPILWEKRAAWHQLVDRNATSQIPALHTLLKQDTADTSTRIHALWALEGLKGFDRDVLQALLSDEDRDLRREATRALTGFALSGAEVAKLLAPLVEDGDATVRAQVLRTLASVKQADPAVIDLLVQACKPALGGAGMGGPYERSFERYLARMAMEQYADALRTYLTSDQADRHSPGNLLWAIQVLPAEEREARFVQLWQKAASQRIDKETFVAIAGMLGSPAVLKVVKPTFEDPANGQHLLKLGMETVDRVQSPQLSKLLAGTLDRLLASSQPEEVIDGLKGVYALRSRAHFAKAAELMQPGQQPDVLKQALRVGTLTKSTKPRVFATLVHDQVLDFDIRLEALCGLIQADVPQGRSALDAMATGADTNQKVLMVNRLTQFPAGGDLALALWEKQTIDLTAWSFAAAERVQLALPKDRRAQQVFREVKQREAVAKAQVHERIEHYIEATRRLKGDPVAGKAVFGTCLACHRVGDMGQDIAPALDGSANRELEHLITAIVDPDAAVEGGYGVFRVTKKDGSTLEGLMVKRDDQGTTIALMGGAKIFTARNEIKAQGFVGGRSFMPPAFGNLPDQTMVDLVAYIKTLK